MDIATYPKLIPSGEGRKHVLIVNDYDHVSKKESLQFLVDTLASLGIDIHTDCYFIHAVIPAKETPITQEINFYRDKLLKIIQVLQPRHIILLGEIPFDSILGQRFSGRITGISYTNFIGEHIPDQELKMFLHPVYHPQFFLEKKQYDNYVSEPLYKRDPGLFEAWKHSLLAAFQLKEFPHNSFNNDYMIIDNVTEAIELLEKACTWPVVSFDYETTGLKPFRKGHRIIAMAISDGLFGYAFPIFRNELFQQMLKKFLTSSNVKKIAHDLRYETLWTREILGYWPQNWYWDTLLGNHCLCNNQSSQLKFLVYVKFGILGYDDTIDAFLSSTQEETIKYGTNALNNILNADIDTVLQYCALDALFTYKLYELQKSKLDDFQLAGLQLLVNTAYTLAKISWNGICIDAERLYEIENILIKKKNELHATIMADPVLQQWDCAEEFNYNSSMQVSHLLFDILKMNVTTYTKKNKPSVNKDSLENYAHIPIIKNILEYRKISKILDTFIAQYKREITYNKVHPLFSVGFVDTFRSSCDSPNIQQNPKRDKLAKEYIRSYIKASPGMKLVEYDFKSLEVNISACHHKDPNFIEYVTNPTKDMHKDMAKKVFLLEDNEVTKEYRQAVKGDAVFAMFYGSYYKEMAKCLWKDAEELGLLPHLAQKGITTYAEFEKHIQNIERDFWNNKFPQYNKWRQINYEFYLQNGYVKQYTGFKCYGPMKKNNTYNTPIQGDAAHVLFYVLNYMQEKFESLQLKSRIIGEIHDSMIIDMAPDEEEIIDTLLYAFIKYKLPKLLSWLIVPLTMEKECSIIDGTWDHMEPCKFMKEDK